MMVEDDRGESFLTVAEVAGWLKLNQQTVRNWIDQGSLPAVRVGRRVRIKRSDLDQLLESGYQAGGASTAESGPSATDFWSGEAVGVAELGDDGATEAGDGEVQDGAAGAGDGEGHDGAAETRDGEGFDPRTPVRTAAQADSTGDSRRP